MVNADKAVNLVVVLLVVGLLTAFLAPVAIGQMSNPEEATYTQAVDETVELQPGLNATVTGVTDGTSATYNITAGGESATTTVNVGANDTVTVDGASVTISPSQATATNATTTYSYPTSYGWGGGASALWNIIPVMIVLAIFLFVTYLAIQKRGF